MFTVIVQNKVHYKQFTYVELSWYVIDANGRALVNWLLPELSKVFYQDAMRVQTGIIINLISIKRDKIHILFYALLNQRIEIAHTRESQMTNGSKLKRTSWITMVYCMPCSPSKIGQSCQRKCYCAFGNLHWQGWDNYLYISFLANWHQILC